MRTLVLIVIVTVTAYTAVKFQPTRKPSVLPVCSCFSPRRAGTICFVLVCFCFVNTQGKRGRYVSQKRKMALCGLTKLIYLLEGELIGFKKPTTGVDMTGMFRTVEATTQAQV